MEERTVTVYTQPLEKGSLLDSKLLASGELKVTKDPARGKHITDIGGVMVRAARKLDPGATVSLTDPSGGPLRWKLALEAAGVRCSLMIRPYTDSAEGAAASTIMVQCTGSQEDITRLIKTFAVLLGRHPCQDMDWESFQARSSIGKDSVTGFWDSLLPPGGKGAGAGDGGVDDAPGEDGGPAGVGVQEDEVRDALDRKDQTAAMSALIKEGVAHFREERFAEAVKVWEKVLRLDPGHKSTLAAIVRARELMGDKGKPKEKKAPRKERKVTPMIKRHCPKCNKLLAIRPVKGQPLRFTCSGCGAKGEFKRKPRTVKQVMPKKPVPATGTPTPAPSPGAPGTLPADRPAKVGEEEIPPPVSPYAAGMMPMPATAGAEAMIVKGASEVMKEMGMEPPAGTAPTGGTGPYAQVAQPLPRVQPRPMAVKKPVTPGPAAGVGPKPMPVPKPVPKPVLKAAAEPPGEKPEATPVVFAADVMASRGAISAGEAEEEEEGEVGVKTRVPKPAPAAHREPPEEPGLPGEPELEEEPEPGEEPEPVEEPEVGEEPEPAGEPEPEEEAAAPSAPKPFILDDAPKKPAGVVSAADVLAEMGVEPPMKAQAQKVSVKVPVGSGKMPLRVKGPLAAPVPGEEEPAATAASAPLEFIREAAPAEPAEPAMATAAPGTAPAMPGPEPELPAPPEPPAPAEEPAVPGSTAAPEAPAASGAPAAAAGAQEPATPPMAGPGELYLRGVALAQNGIWQQALSVFEQVLMEDPGHLDALNDKGVVLFNIGRRTEAQEIYDKVHKADPDKVDTWFNKAHLLMTEDRLKPALDCFKKVLELEPDSGDAWYFRGLILFQLKRYEESAKNFEQATRVAPEDVDTWFNHSYALEMARMYEDALDGYQVVLGLDPNHVQAELGMETCLREIRLELLKDWNP